jgi:hypothetical protein
MVTTFERIKATASAEVGYREGFKKGHFNNNTKFADEVPGLESFDFQPWCATFVAWVALKAGVPELYPKTPSCDAAGSWFKARKRWSEYPARGAQAFYGSPKDLSHTGIVIDFDADTITTIEGNTNDTGSREGNGVYKKVRRRRDANVIGFGYPMFPEGIESADPDFPRVADQVAGHAASQGASDGAGKRKRVDGVDISHHQADPLDFAAAKAAGLKFVIHKVTEGRTFVDEKYAARRPAVAAAGLAWGGYHFARPAASTAAKQAQFFLSRLKPEPGDIRPVLDLEVDGGLSPLRLAEWANDFCDEVRARLGASPIIYTPFDLGETGCQLWVARYSNSNKAPRIPSGWKTYAIWQFSNGAFGVPNQVAGLGHVDLDTLGVGVKIDDLRIPAKDVVIPKQRAATSPMAAALAANQAHTDALLKLPKDAESSAMIEQMLAALAAEREQLKQKLHAPAAAGKG